MDKIIFLPEFVTATIYNWQHLLKRIEHKEIICNSLKFLVDDNRIILYAYCIMDNHIHLIWQVKGKWKTSDVKRDFLKYTAHELKRSIQKYQPLELENYRATQQDRTYQIWERNSLCVELYTPEVFDQKIDYIHYNPVKAGLCKQPEQYAFSSAEYYMGGLDRFSFLSHINF